MSPAPALPAALAPLEALALDLRWTWRHAGDRLWRRLNAEVWERTQNAWATVRSATPETLAALAEDPSFLHALGQLAAAHERYLTQPRWFQHAHAPQQDCRIAYFSLEFGLGEAMPLYAGGLGVLAGDLLKTASDLGVPVLGVGLLYQEGCFRQMLDANGRQREVYAYNDPATLPLQPLLDARGAWLRVPVPLPGRVLQVRVWQARVGVVRLLLLDSNDLRNGPADRGITAKLYGHGTETRLLQEMVLGVGGWSALEALGAAPAVCHLNEGHTAFALVERARRFMQRASVGFGTAWWACRAGNVFTTHTPVATGFDLYPPELIGRYFADYLPGCGLTQEAFLALGRLREGDAGEPFNMACLALRGCARTNGVSALHAQVSRQLFGELYPRFPPAEVPIGHVTNGVHMPTWDSAGSDALWTRACGKERWLGAVDDLAVGIEAVDDLALWQLLAGGREALIAYARERLAWQLAQRGAPAEQIAAAGHVLDPNALTLGLARRFVAYKRPNLLLSDPPRLARLLGDPRRPVQVVVAGKAHPDDQDGQALIAQWIAFAQGQGLRSRVVYLEDYDIALAQKLVQGVDLWINTPRRPWEACGTSGMKVLANGGLNLSTLDGWWAEAYTPEVGWAIGDGHEGLADEEVDARDALALYRLLEDEVVPLYYERDAAGIPRGWVRRMRASIARLAPRFSSNRMLQQYVREMYLPAAAALQARCADGAALARELADWERQLQAGWEQVHLGELRIEREGEAWHVAVAVYLGQIAPEAVRVELYADAVEGWPAQRRAMTRAAPIVGSRNGFVYEARVAGDRPASHFTPRVLPWHDQARVPAELALVRWPR